MKIPVALNLLPSFLRRGETIHESRDVVGDVLDALHVPEPAALLLPSCDSYTVKSQINSSPYDYLVVGAGAGGGPVAARLALEGKNVLLIEAGKDYVSLNTTIPLYLIQATEDPVISLDYYVNHYPKDAKYGDVKTWYPRAQGLGGCTIHNALINLIPHKWDFDTLASAFNDPSWGWQNMANYYTKIENNLYIDKVNGTALGHGYDGWLSTQLPPVNLLTDPKYYDPQLIDVVTAIRSARQPVLSEDYNVWANDEAEGGAWIVLTKQANETRNTVRDHLVDVHNAYPNRLQFAFENFATKILTCRTNKGKIAAYGVETLQGANLNPVSSLFKGKGKGIKGVKRYYAKKEVILSAGPFETPKILMHSGVGDRVQLLKNGIAPLVHSPGVGQNLQDRVEETTVFDLKQNHTVFNGCKFGYSNSTDPCLEEWFDDGRSNLYASGAALYAWSYKSDESLPYRDVFSFWGPAAFFGYFPGWGAKTIGIHNAVLNAVLKAHTSARGWVKLTGPGVQDVLEINKNEFQTPESLKDRTIVKDAMKEAASWANSTDLFNKHVASSDWPGPAVQTDDEYNDFITKNQWGHHACCTAKMGTDNDQSAVLDGNFKVRGVSNLRVVDLSIWPTIPGMFVATPMYMVSEKAADVILAGH